MSTTCTAGLLVGPLKLGAQFNSKLSTRVSPCCCAIDECIQPTGDVVTMDTCQAWLVANATRSAAASVSKHPIVSADGTAFVLAMNFCAGDFTFCLSSLNLVSDQFATYFGEITFKLDTGPGTDSDCVALQFTWSDGGNGVRVYWFNFVGGSIASFGTIDYSFVGGGGSSEFVKITAVGATATLYFGDGAGNYFSAGSLTIDSSLLANTGFGVSSGGISGRGPLVINEFCICCPSI